MAEEEQEQAGRKTWLEVALNGPWGRERQPRAPIAFDDIVNEGIACAEAGAAIIHVHAYDEATGRQTDDWQAIARIIAGIRNKADVIVYPTIPFQAAGTLDAATRFTHLDELGKRGLIEWAAIDPGSCNITHWDEIQADRHGFVYLNPEDHIRHGLTLARRHQFHPAYAIYEPGFLRLGAALHWRESTPAPVYRFMFTSDYSFGFPPEDFGLTAYLHLLDRLAPGAAWMVGGLGVDVLDMIPRTIVEGGHVRVGLEDASFGTDRSNVELVTDAAERIANMGAALATAEDVRAALEPDE
ncbi:MAG: 3-keto-5-aminohexanoate cleavage protein [Burkholderiales bacterium]|nr:3-keto-5-aminohexanoate cleavage protein [Burkholderiales bacterium]